MLKLFKKGFFFFGYTTRLYCHRSDVDNNRHPHTTDSTDSSWLNMTWHLYLHIKTSHSHPHIGNNVKQCVCFFSPRPMLFPQNTESSCAETLPSCSPVTSCSLKTGLLSRHNKPVYQSREPPLTFICLQPRSSLKWSKLRQYVHTRSEIVFGNF